MKKELLFIMTVLLMPSGAWADVWQDPATKVKYEYSVGESEASVIQSLDVKGAVSILSQFSVNGQQYKVTSIGRQAFYTCRDLTSITIPEGVTTIGASAFGQCHGLTDVTIPSTMKSFGNCAFSNCSVLTNVHIKDLAAWCQISSDKGKTSNPLETAAHLFLNGSEVTNLVVPSGVTSIGQCAFTGWNGLKKVTIPATVSDVGEGAFVGCTNLSEITCGANIGQAAFSGCTSLTKVTLLEGISEISEYAFFECEKLTDIAVPASLTKVGVGNGTAFGNCKSITNIYVTDLAAWCQRTYQLKGLWSSDGPFHLFMNGQEVKDLVIPESVKEISGRAFSKFASLTSVTIPQGVTSIGASAFSSCSGLTAVYIPQSVTSIGNYAFSGCSGLTAVHIKDLAAWCGIEFGQKANPLNSAHHLFLNNEEVKEMVIPEGVTAIGALVFEGCQGLTSVTISTTLKSIGSSAFNGCTNLKAAHVKDLAAYCEISGGGNLLGEAQHLYMNNQEVKDLVIPEGVTAISGGAFANCKSLTSVTIPSTLKSIGYQAFRDCSGLTAVHIKDLAAWCKMKTNDSWTPLYYAHHLYLNSEEVSDLIIPEGVTAISGYVFAGCEGLTSVNIGKGVKTIGIYAFAENTNLKTVTIGSDVESIFNANFYNCEKLERVTSLIAEPFELSEEYVFQNLHETNGQRSWTFTTATLYVPIGTKEKYEATNGWKHFSNIIEQVYIEPVKGETTVSTEGLGNEDLTDNVVDDIYYNVGDNSYDSSDKSVVISQTTNMGQITDATPGSEDVKQNFNGLILKVAAGKGTITVNVKTTGNAQLVVQVGNQTPMIASKTEQGDVVFSYDVTEDTYVYIYAIIGSSAARATRASSDNVVKIYGITVTPGATGITNALCGTSGTNHSYMLDGRKVVGQPTKKGVYIVNSQKIVVK